MCLLEFNFSIINVFNNLNRHGVHKISMIIRTSDATWLCGTDKGKYQFIRSKVADDLQNILCGYGHIG